MSVRGWLLCTVLVIGCAHSPLKPEEVTPQFEHVFQKPLEEALATTRALLVERGLQFEATVDPNQLLTTWNNPSNVGTGNNRFSRYLVTGIAVSPRQSVVRIFKMSFNVMGNDVNHQNVWWKINREAYEASANPFEDPQRLAALKSGQNRIELRTPMRGIRDMDLERELTLRLESGPSVEVVSGTVKQEPVAMPVRDMDFYLTRWKDTGAEPGQCGTAIRGLAGLMSPGLTLLVGEQLGSREAPTVVGELVCQVAEAGLPVALGIALPRTEQERVNRYLASGGSPADQDALLEGRFWRRPYQDGRSSRAMLDLIDRVRAMRMAGLSVSLVAYDTDTAGGSQRDAQQAALWNERREAQQDEVQVLLAGNTHTRTVTGAAWDKSFTPMASLMKAPRFIVLDMSYAQGTRWGCDLDPQGQVRCGLVGTTPVERLAARPGLNPYIDLYDEPTSDGSHGHLYVGRLTASLPAMSKPEQPRPATLREPPAMGAKKPSMF
ncbi:hypothetical protein MYSTI_03407 [Myxococcus stipitatus DSM 14675]|uniref:Lipoprotein n=1 Tax=Myxococcus stipitatus (strain DSM 14675 / JCM 12634 / Mx s8) TaxID=1278073 RepID=L7UE52_MYXSD|nr:hypothetical protein [Myxococcus stipitatus]AGC44719.1 hypothetical protein MYSTI_03407 [Myxococcus stipitatus DSM 14675]